jgi:hypothetical protein
MNSRKTIRSAGWRKRVSRLIWHLLVVYEAMEEKLNE